MLLTIVAPTCSGTLLIICISAVVTFCIMRRKNKSKSVMLEPESKALMVDVPPYLVDPVEMRRQHYQTPGGWQQQSWWWWWLGCLVRRWMCERDNQKEGC